MGTTHQIPNNPYLSMSKNHQQSSQKTDPSNLPGWPGYRTRSNRSGLDPVDSYREQAFLEGMFIRKLFPLQLRTRNRFYLFLMLLFGLGLLALSLPFIFYAFTDLLPYVKTVSVMNAMSGVIGLTLMLGIPLAFGIGLLVNFAINLSVINGTHSDSEQQKENDPKKEKKPKKSSLNIAKITSKPSFPAY